MIQYLNIQRHDNVPFDQYLKLPGLSHSFLKREKNGIAEDITITENIRIGKIVDGILTEREADMFDPLYPYSRDIANKIQQTFGSMIQHFQKQVSYTANMQCGDFIMPTKGRLDFLLPKHAVIDLKVTKSRDIRSLIEYMGYFQQIWHYCKMANVRYAYLMIHSIPLKKTELVKFDCGSNTNQFWQEKITLHGKVSEFLTEQLH